MKTARPLPGRLLWLTAGLALVVVVLGAYVRLSDAGLGCPDWPGCYGQASPWHAAEAIAAAHSADPLGPVSHAKAWKEMAHRYLAGLLGMAVLGIALLAWRRLPPRQAVLPGALLLLVVCQALLGMWTVTLQLRPAVVAAHLLGGMATLALLVWLLPAGRAGPPSWPRALLRPARLALGLVAAQIALGGWMSANYAALACPDLPTCQGAWWPDMDFATAYGLVHRPEDLLPAALTAIHMTHRLGAVLALAGVLWLAWRMLRMASLRAWGGALLALAGGQILLGLGNVLLALPLPVAAAHNAGAALLLAALARINARLAGGAP